MRCRNSPGPLDECARAGRSDRPQVAAAHAAHAQPRNPGGFTSLINDKLWAAVGLERKTLSCSWNLYHPDIRREESEEYDLSGMLKGGRQLRGGAVRNRMNRAKPYRVHADRAMSNAEASTSYAAGREQAGEGAELGSCAVCLAWCDRREVAARPLVRCCKCRQPMHVDCYSAQAGGGLGRDRPAYCPEHEPLALPDKRRAEHDASRHVRLRLSSSGLSSASDSEDDEEDVLSLSVPRGLRSAGPAGRGARRPRVPQSVHPALPPLAWEQPAATATTTAPAYHEPVTRMPSFHKADLQLTKAYSFGLDAGTPEHAGSNHSSPSHTACSPPRVRHHQHRASPSVETESASEPERTPPSSSSARSTSSEASDMCEEDTLHYGKSAPVDKQAHGEQHGGEGKHSNGFQPLSSCAVDSRAALCHRQAVTC